MPATPLPAGTEKFCHLFAALREVPVPCVPHRQRTRHSAALSLSRFPRKSVLPVPATAASAVPSVLDLPPYRGKWFLSATPHLLSCLYTFRGVIWHVQGLLRSASPFCCWKIFSLSVPVSALRKVPAVFLHLIPAAAPCEVSAPACARLLRSTPTPCYP